MITEKFNAYRPKSITEAHNLLEKHDDIAILAGGTDYVPLMKYGLKKPSALIITDGLEELYGIKLEDDQIHIGALEKIRNIAMSDVLQSELPSLNYAAIRVASPQIRNQGTLGGNLLQDRRCIFYNQTDSWRCSLSPCFKLGGQVCHQRKNSKSCVALYYSDLAPLLLALNAHAEIFDGETRIIGLEELLHNHIETNGTLSGRKYMLKKVIVDRANIGRNMFEKIAVRNSINFPVINVGINILDIPTVYVGAIAPMPQKIDVSSGTETKILSEIQGKEKIIPEAIIPVATKRKYYQSIARIISDFI